MTNFPVHDRLPNGFVLADRLQIESFERTGSVNGASKVCFVCNGLDPVVKDGVVVQSGYDLAVRLRPPSRLEDVASNLGRGAVKTVEEYIAEYNRGWNAGRRGTGREFDTGYTSHAYDDGYLDAAAGRMKWHLTYCPDHDECGEG